jgi:hypothetical protein
MGHSTEALTIMQYLSNYYRNLKACFFSNIGELKIEFKPALGVSNKAQVGSSEEHKAEVKFF